MASSTVPENNQMNFNPSWMRSTSTANNIPVAAGKLSTNRVDAPALNVAHDYPLSEPIFVKNRYGREDLLALLPKDSKYPDGLQKCQFFIEMPQQPIVLTPLTDAETRLQHNINSSKAMSALSHAERTAIASSNVMGQGSANVSIGTAGQVSQTSWTGGSGIGRGGSQGARGGFGIFRGRGGQTLSTGGHSSNLTDSTSGNRYAYSRGRANTALGRGGSTATFNSRAQGLYDPRDPRDRPRQRVRSVSDDTASPLMSAAVNVGSGQSVDDSSSPGNGWSQASNRGGWRKYTPTGITGMHQHSSVDSPTTNRSLMPEWMVDEQEKGSGLVVTRSGSFDENGQFKASDSGSPKISTSSTPGSIIAKLSCSKDNKPLDAHVRTQTSPRTPDPIPISNPWNVISETPENRIDIDEQLAQQTQMSLLLPSASLTRLSSSDIFETKVPEDVQVTQRPMVTTVAEDEWYYVDPGNSLQGPFPTSHMEAWFKSGYFTSNLNVRRGSGPNSHFQTLGELIQINGATSPFRSKPVEPASIVPVHLSLQSQSHEISSNPWTGEISDSLFKVAKVEEQRQKLKEEQRRVAEKEKELKEMQEKLKRQEEERLMKVREMELKLQKQQEELARREAEERKRAVEREREIEEERKRIAEEIERAKREELEKALAEQRRREEEQRAAREKEFERMKAEAERLRCEKEKEEAARRAAEKAEEEARMLVALEEQKKVEAEHRERERVKRAAEARRQINAGTNPSLGSNVTAIVGSTATETSTVTAPATNKIEVTEVYAPAAKVKTAASGVQNSGMKTWHASYRVGDEKLITPKVAPWQSSTEEAISQSGKREKSLLEIQQEEERQLLAERKQKQEVSVNARGNAVSSTATGGVWAASPQKLLWNQSGPALNRQTSPTTKNVAWGGAGLHQEAHPAISIFFDGPSLETSNKQSKKSSCSPTKGVKTSGKDVWQTASKQDSSRVEQETVKKLFKQSAMTNSSDGFTNWVIQRVKKLNPQVDADVLAEFIENVDSPDEVEDYIIGYLGDSIQVKEFIKEFLAKRGDARLKKRAPVKDDLSGPAPAADPSLCSTGNGFGGSAGNSQHATSGGKKKRKGKSGRLIVDGACLGFKGTADSNRVNIGEIATLSAMEVGHR